ncbi:recombinase family protein [Shewanella algae]|uniref:recombinase family protein n=1 Tax=Shewanella algae TaxID=38313 RepID=UPI002230A2DD|nr:recombinase family protein [Shewanella algae]UZD59543.1 recombinase family protein [Shewanella algae]
MTPTKQPTSPKGKVFSYVRFSSAAQELGSSLARQYELTRQWAAQNGYEVDDNLKFEDLGVSGFKQDARREGLERLLAAIDAGYIKPGDVVAIERLDRLSRGGLGKSQQLLNQILSRGVNVVAVEENLFLNKDSPEVLNDLLRVLFAAELANRQSVEKSKRVKDAKRRQRAAAAEGKVIRKRLPIWLTMNEDGTGYTFETEHVETVKQIISLRRRGRGWSGIAADLNADGRRVRWGRNGWSDTSVRAIITNPALYGAYQSGEMRPVGGDESAENGRLEWIPGELVLDFYPALITYAEWRELQPGKAAAAGGQAGGNSRTNALAGVARCSECGGTLTRKCRQRKNKEGEMIYYAFWTCRQGEQGRCPIGASGFKDLGSEVVAACKHLEWVNPVNLGDVNRARDKLEQELDRVAGLLERLQKQLVEGDADDVDIVLPLIKKAKQDRSALENELDLLNRQTASETARSDIERLGSLAGDPEAFNNLLRKVVDRIVVRRRGRLSYSFTVEQSNGHQFRVDVIRTKQGQDPVRFYNRGVEGLPEPGDLYPWETDQEDD